MTPKQKAIELVEKFEDNLIECDTYFLQEAKKRCALIAVDEIINSNPCFEDLDRGGNLMYNNNTYYWQEVKEEINKL